MSLIFILPVASADQCEKDGFATCAYGFKWGDIVTVETMKINYCANYPNVSNTDLGQVSLSRKKDEAPGPIPPGTPCESLDKKLNHAFSSRNCDFAAPCTKASGSFLKFSTLESLTAACYIGSFYTSHCTESRDPNTQEIFKANFLPPFFSFLQSFPDYAEIKTLNEQKASLHYFPVGENSMSRFLVTIDNKLVALSISSPVPTDIEPKFFALQAKKKYGEPLKEIKLESGRYSDVIIWQKKAPNDDLIHVLLIDSKQQDPQAPKAQVQTIYYSKQNLRKVWGEHQASKATKDNNKNQNTQKKTEQGLNNVDF